MEKIENSSNDKNNLKISFINGFFSIISSLIVAFVVSYYSQKATLDAVMKSTKSAEDIAAKQLELQIKQVEITNKNQIDAIILTAEKNLEALRENAKVSRELQSQLFLNEKKSEIEKEQRERKIISSNSKTFVSADISARVSILSDEIFIADKALQIVNSISIKDDNASLLTKIKYIGILLKSFGQNAVVVEEESIMKQLALIDDSEITDIAIAFYRIMQIFVLRRDKIEPNTYIDDLAKDIKDITDLTNDQSNKLIEIVLAGLRTNIESYKQFLLRIIVIGNTTNIKILKSSGKDFKALEMETDELAKNMTSSYDRLLSPYSDFFEKLEELKRQADKWERNGKENSRN